MAAIFSRIADALEIKGEVAFKVLLYRKAAWVLEDLSEDIETVAREKRLPPQHPESWRQGIRNSFSAALAE
ncbi:MAG: hypothetical protein AB1715_01570 [Acidobacteriota bacterium]